MKSKYFFMLRPVRAQGKVENQRIFGLICSLHRALVRNNDINLAEYGVSAVQLHALVFTKIRCSRGERVCQRDIERATGLRPSSVSAMLVNLEKGGFLTRCSSADDARTKYISLTEKGEELCERNRELMDMCDERINSSLTPEELASFRSIILKVLNSLEN